MGIVWFMEHTLRSQCVNTAQLAKETWIDEGIDGQTKTRVEGRNRDDLYLDDDDDDGDDDDDDDDFIAGLN
jgi:hypothetical protein